MGHGKFWCVLQSRQTSRQDVLVVRPARSRSFVSFLCYFRLFVKVALISLFAYLRAGCVGFLVVCMADWLLPCSFINHLRCFLPLLLAAFVACRLRCLLPFLFAAFFAGCRFCLLPFCLLPFLLAAVFACCRFCLLPFLLAAFDITNETKWCLLCHCYDKNYAAGPALIKTKIPRFYLKDARAKIF